ncbi:hypothetical protein [Iodidimonas sp. MBR-14]|uniref:hypothetical protein n=1 Tax=Iodidimonas sp. MBR-14 TaxID=3032319 RepID=UPI002482E485|nr:hypothetical protein [Iodidimonas sp. MBR-14]
MLSMIAALGLAACKAGSPAPEAHALDNDVLAFQLQEGRILNSFYRQGPVAAHMLATAGLKPRIITAYPAGNSDVSLWFKALSSPIIWHQSPELIPESRHQDGTALHGAF